ncbi:hypothetical protein IWX90DRAFT_508083 [Phyllosticta citrichinensis]|uniref:Protein kinase domain-containing protein n=1 Tax=Phyllosticta citrichinensis TaxID=1130410 RepID=A0ABR1XLA2_9PEZI
MFSRTAPNLGRLVGRQILRKDMKLTGESGLQYLLTDNLAGLEGHVWIAKDARNKNSSWFIVKQPKWPYINKAGSWAERLREFEHEVKMNEIFQGAKYIRQQADTIKPTSEDDPPRMVLEAMWDSVGRVHTARLFTRKEIKAMMKTTLQALQEVEQKDLMHPNTILSNFSLQCSLHMNDMLIKTPSLDPHDPPKFIAKIANPISFIEPNREFEGQNLMQCPTAAPEMLFGKPVGFPAHIWSWGIILCHLLESTAGWTHGNLEYQWTSGLFEYDERQWDLRWASGEDWWLKEMVDDFKIDSCDYYADCDMPDIEVFKPCAYDWKERLRIKGVREDDVCFLDWVLDPNPDTRPTSERIMQSGYMEWNSEDEDGKP